MKSGMNNRAFGAQGEREAASFLAKQGYTILCRNFRAGRMGEIDIIALDGEMLCFIEVKTRSGDRYGTPSEAVSARKQSTIRRIAQIYMQRSSISDKPVRFDVAELMMDHGGRIRDIGLIKNAF